MDRNPRRGVHLPHTLNSRVIRSWEYEALGVIWPGSVSILDYQLGDAELVRWLERRAHDGVEVYCRVYNAGVPDPASVASTIHGIAVTQPWIKAFLPANEQNIEGWTSAAEIDRWNSDLWWNIANYRAQGMPITLLYPPLAQDAPLNHTQVWDACRGSIELYLNSGDGFAWHDYWTPDNTTRMIEDEMPAWLQDMLRSNNVPLTLIHECGRKTDSPADFIKLGPEFITRYGNHLGSPGLSHARAVTGWLLASSDPQFDGQAWVDNQGGLRQVVLDYGSFGP